MLQCPCRLCAALQDILGRMWYKVKSCWDIDIHLQHWASSCHVSEWNLSLLCICICLWNLRCICQPLAYSDFEQQTGLDIGSLEGMKRCCIESHKFFSSTGSSQGRTQNSSQSSCIWIIFEKHNQFVQADSKQRSWGWSLFGGCLWNCYGLWRCCISKQEPWISPPPVGWLASRRSECPGGYCCASAWRSSFPFGVRG